MNLLLDTHCLLWWIGDDEQLSEEQLRAIASPRNTVFLSPVVLWEIRIKQSLGKLDIPRGFRRAVDNEQFAELPITHDHADRVGQLPPIHRDPFDRLLVAQAQAEDLILVTQDEQIRRYDVPCL